MKFVGSCCCFGSLVLFTGAALQASTVPVTINLGQSAQNYVEYGQGPDSNGNGVYDLQQGSCNFSGGLTTCTLSGNFTGATQGFTGGTYSLITTYSGNNPNSLMGVSEAAPNQNYFSYSSASSSLSMVLDLTAGNGSSTTETLVQNGHGASTTTGINFAFTSFSCSGTPVTGGCSPYDVGLTSGAIGQGPVTGTIGFDISSSGPTGPGSGSAVPEPRFAASFGLLVLASGAVFLRRRKTA